MAEIDKSIKLVFNEFQRSISEVPLEVYYQTLNADQYNAAGYQFNIKQPGAHALLDTDIWIEFNIRIADKDANPFAIEGLFEANAANFSAHVPRARGWIAYRSGYLVQRCTQNFSLQINNQTLNVRPNYYVDVLNRLYVSNDQSEHEFCTSGGRFEEGNHGHRLCNPAISNPNTGLAIATGMPNGGQATTYSGMIADAYAGVHNAAVAGSNAHIVPYLFVNQPWSIKRNEAVFPTGDTAMIYGWPEYPNTYEFTNPGCDRRRNQMALRLRQNLDFQEAGGAVLATVEPGRGTLIRGDPKDPVVANALVYNFKVFERLPISIFKMYSNDDVYGVIPNITQMQIQGNFVNNFLANFLRSDTNMATIEAYWNNIQQGMCKIYLRWYTGPKSMPIPREIHIPYKKIVTWSKSAPIAATNTAAGAHFVDNLEVNEYNISIEAIPDLLLIYMKLQAGNYTLDTPDDFNMEIRNLSINIDNASGKLNQIQSIDLYNKWKRLLKHSDSKIIGYEEWRRYCCVACLQPEDYGVRYGPGYSNPCVLGLKFTPRNWHINPSIHAGPPFVDANAGVAIIHAVGALESNHEYLGGAAGAGIQTELVVTQIFYKNKLIIRADGTCSQEMVKVAADFDMRAPEVESGGMGASGFGAQNA